MTNKRVLKAESALDVIKIINDEIGVEGTFGLQDARLSLMSPNGQFMTTLKHANGVTLSESQKSMPSCRGWITSSKNLFPVLRI